jgi:hypothetical protein
MHFLLRHWSVSCTLAWLDKTSSWCCIKADNECNCVLMHHNAIDLVVSSERRVKTYIMRPLSSSIHFVASIISICSGLSQTRIRSVNVQVNASRTEREYVGLFFGSGRNILVQHRLARCASAPEAVSDHSF